MCEVAQRARCRRQRRSCPFVAQLAEQAVELVERRESDRDLATVALARAGVAHADLDRCGKSVGELTLETKNVIRLLTFRAQQRCLATAAGGAPGGELLRLAYVQAFGDDLVGA